MEIWQFWLCIVVIFGLLGVILAILIRKHKDKQKIANLQKNIESLEKHFQFLKEDIEFATNRNLSAIKEEKDKMIELLSLADGKIDHADNLLKELETDTKILKELSVSSSNNIIDFPSEKQKIIDCVEEKFASFIHELREDVSSVKTHLDYINNRVSELENKSLEEPKIKVNEIDNDELKLEIIELKRQIKELKSSISEKVTDEISKQLKLLDDGFSEIATDAIEQDLKNPLQIPEGVEIPEELKGLFTTSENVEPTEAKPVIETNGEAEAIEYYPKGNELVVKEIMESFEQGISIPQIASNLEMSRGEIALIIKYNQMKAEKKDNIDGN